MIIWGYKPIAEEEIENEHDQVLDLKPKRRMVQNMGSKPIAEEELENEHIVLSFCNSSLSYFPFNKITEPVFPSWFPNILRPNVD